MTRCEHKPGERAGGFSAKEQPPAPERRMGPGGAATTHQLKPPSRLPLASSRLSPTAANGTRTAEPWSCHFRDLLADLAGKKQEQPKNVTSCTQIQGPSQPWSCECPSYSVPGPWEVHRAGMQPPPSPRPSPGSRAVALRPPTRPADMRCRAAPSAPGLGTTWSSAKLLLAGLRRSRRGAAQNYLQHYYFFFKHMLVYENNHPGTVQAYTDKSTLRHEGLPKEWGKASTHPLSGSSTATERGTAIQGPFRNGIPRRHQYSNCRS